MKKSGHKSKAWLQSSDPAFMLTLLIGKLDSRKARLFMAGCYRRIEPFYALTNCTNVIEVVERLADGDVGRSELSRMRKQESAVLREHHYCQGNDDQFHWQLIIISFSALWHPTRRRLDNTIALYTDSGSSDPAPHHEKLAVHDLLRDIFGNPFRPVAFSPSWRTSTAIGVAQQMYDSRDFGAMPILADALQDAGCEDESILSHCRGDGPHVRGCWVVDLVLGKQ